MPAMKSERIPTHLLMVSWIDYVLSSIGCNCVSIMINSKNSIPDMGEMVQRKGETRILINQSM